MVVIQSYPLAVMMCVVTMLCWGSWANTQKLASKEWKFQLFYWDYCIGVVLLTLIFALTMGSIGSGGRGRGAARDCDNTPTASAVNGRRASPSEILARCSRASSVIWTL